MWGPDFQVLQPVRGYISSPALTPLGSSSVTPPLGPVLQCCPGEAQSQLSHYHDIDYRVSSSNYYRQQGEWGDERRYHSRAHSISWQTSSGASSPTLTLGGQLTHAPATMTRFTVLPWEGTGPTLTSAATGKRQGHFFRVLHPVRGGDSSCTASGHPHGPR